MSFIKILSRLAKLKYFLLVLSLILIIPFTLLPIISSPHFPIISDARAATYYVDATNGNDANNSLSESTPWKTIAKVNASIFQPGDQILLKRGEVWREQLTVPSSGTSGNPITFGAYGSETNPIISGADILTAWTSEAGYSFTTYYASATAQPSQVIVDGSTVFNQNVTSKTSLLAGQWFWDSANKRVYLRLSDGSNPSGHTVEASMRDYCIYNTKQYTTFKNISIYKSANNGYYQSGGGYLTIDSVVSSYTVGNGFLFRSGNLTLSNLIAEYNAYYGISFDGVYGNIKLTNPSTNYNGWDGIHLIGTYSITITGGTTSYNGSASHEGNGIGVSANASNISHDVTINNLSSHHNAGNGFDAVGGGGNGSYNITVNGGQYHDNTGGPSLCSGVRLDTLTHDSIVRYVRAYNNQSAGIVVEDQAYDNQIYYNLAYTNERGITHSNNPGVGNVYYNNVAYSNTQDGFQVYSARNVATIKNNIFSNNGRYGYNTDGGSHVIDYNLVYGNSTANYNGISKPRHDINSDPLFTNPAPSYFTLQPTSPAIDAGTDVGLTQDYAGNPIYGTPDIGAYENQPRPTPPKDLRIVVP